jgi:hypothetical protein
MLLLSQMMAGGAWSIGQIAVAVIIVLALVGIVLIAAKAMGVTIPQWAWQIIGIVVVAFVAIVAIKFVLSM